MKCVAGKDPATSQARVMSKLANGQARAKSRVKTCKRGGKWVAARSNFDKGEFSEN